MSTKSILPPRCKAQLDDATNVFGVVHNILFFLKPNAIQDMCKALVALFVAAANFTFTF